MKTPNKPSRRAVYKQEELLTDMRARIIAGEWMPAARLPVWRDIAEDYGVSLMTVRTAMQELAHEGFVETRGTAGSYVCERLPHLSRIAVVLDTGPSAAHMSRFLVALINEAQAFKQQTELDIDIMYHVDGHADSEDFQRLNNDARRSRLAGVFLFQHVQSWLDETSVFTNAALPKIHLGPADTARHLSGMCLNRSELFGKALRYFAEQSRKRVAIIHGPMHGDEMSMVKEIIAETGLRTWHRIGISTPQAARSVAHLLMRLPPEDRPDALFITDDNAVEHATAGLVDAAVSAEDISVVGHCNFPWPTPSVFPSRRLGYDTQAIFAKGLEVLSEMSQGAQAMDVEIVPCWEEDIQQV